MDNKKLYILFLMGIILSLTCFGFFYLGVTHACGDGYRQGYTCVEPISVAACSEFYEGKNRLYVIPEELNINVSDY